MPTALDIERLAYIIDNRLTHEPIACITAGDIKRLCGEASDVSEDGMWDIASRVASWIPGVKLSVEVTENHGRPWANFVTIAASHTRETLQQHQRALGRKLFRHTDTAVARAPTRQRHDGIRLTPAYQSSISAPTNNGVCYGKADKR